MRGRQSEANERDKSVACTYRYHTNILGVNKTVQNEARQEFHRSNRLVLISWVWPGLGRTLHGFDLPIVTENQTAIAAFEHHALRLHLQHCTPRSKLGAAAMIQSLLMLHADLPTLTRTIRYVSATMSKPVSIVIKDVNVPDHQQ